LTVHVGTSGWSYPHWHGIIYEPGSPPSGRLARYVEQFDSVELNASFYRWPPPAAFASWRRRLPARFAMSVKAPRGLTHARGLYQPEQWVERIKSGWHELGDRRAVLIVQLAPDHQRDDVRLRYFLDQLPAWLRVAVEFRHPSWIHEHVFHILEDHQAAYCVTSGARLPCVLRVTAPHVYVRLHGPDHHHLYAGAYSDNDLRWWADRIAEWQASGHNVYAYFNNDGGGNAVHNAITLNALVQGERS
jgi:uncharacterized protein YecE (DUF72 family)